MVKGFRPSLEAPAHRQVNNSARPILCFFICVGVAILVFSAFGASGWNIYIHRFDYNRQFFSAGDEVAISDVTSDFSSFFCQSYEVTLYKPGQVYLLSGSAEVNKSLIGQDESISMLQVPGFPYRELSLYLLDQSELSLSACRQNGSRDLSAEIVLIKGKENVRSWRRDRKCESCVLKRVRIPEDSRCSNEEDDSRHSGSGEDFGEVFEDEAASLSAGAKSHQAQKEAGVKENRNPFVQRWKQGVNETENPRQKSPTDSEIVRRRKHTTFHHTILSNDMYSILIFYGNPRGPDSLLRPGIELTGTVRRTTFKVQNATEVCVVSGTMPEPKETNKSSANTCHFDLPWRSNMDVVVHFGDFSSSGDEETFGDSEKLSNGSVAPAEGRHTELTFPRYDGMATKCQVRLSVWICLFGVLPVAIVVFISVVSGVVLCRRHPRQFTARWKKATRSKKKHRGRGGDGGGGLVAEEVLPEDTQSSMAIQGD
ncbi:hypothetical protein EGW08_019081 [Elysia chlorotica]|uniref:Transmembrane protein n=1 Tax=Elysia chlorotica TaxID=188477 RepID=A0A433SV87_ELYCH|nr:hypothetical protein EGW08_019081 [Elysia chlorotica]